MLVRTTRFWYIALIVKRFYQLILVILNSFIQRNIDMIYYLYRFYYPVKRRLINRNRSDIF